MRKKTRPFLIGMWLLNASACRSAWPFGLRSDEAERARSRDRSCRRDRAGGTVTVGGVVDGGVLADHKILVFAVVASTPVAIMPSAASTIAADFANRSMWSSASERLGDRCCPSLCATS